MEMEVKGQVEDLIVKVNEFEKTVSGLLANIKKFKEKLLENKKKFGSDTSKWPIKNK